MKISIKGMLSKSAVVTASTLLLSGCFGGSPEIKAPVTDREQSLNPAVMSKISNEYGVGRAKDFDEKEKSGEAQLIEKASLNKLVTAKELQELMKPLLVEASKIFKARGLPEEIVAAAPKFLQGDIDSLQITLYSRTNKHGKKNFNASYTPFNDIYIENLDLSTEAGKNKAQFVLAHELGHAVALHVTEDETSIQEALDGGADLANLALDIAANELYASLNSTQKNVIDTSLVANSSRFNITTEDYSIDSKLMKLRKDSFAAKAAIASGETKAMNALGFGFEIPQKTRVVLKKLLKTGLDSAGITQMINNSAEAVMQSAMVVVHSQDQELEADKIAQKILSNLKKPVQKTACTLFSSKKSAGFFDAHPSHEDRLSNLGINCK